MAGIGAGDRHHLVALLVIHARELGFRYPTQSGDALADVSLDIAPGGVTWITGHLGSGTSTLLTALAGLAPRLTGGTRRGTVTIDGADPALRSPVIGGIAFLSATPELQLSGIARTVREEIAIGPMNLGWSPHAITAAIDASILRFGIAHLADRIPTRLSGGETQRVMLAALDAVAPVCWLLDEPFSALDTASRATVGAIIRDVAAAGATVVVASDDADTMATLADRLVVFERGRCVLDGLPGELLAGEALHDVGAGSTDAAELARRAGMGAPRPITTAALARAVAGDGLDVRSKAPPLVSDPATAVHFERVTFRYSGGPPVLHGVDVQLPAGVATGIFGANGAGKSTLLRLAMALEQPVSGTVRVLGQSTSGRQPEDLAARVGFLFQRPERQLFATSVRAECRFSARLAGWPEQRIALATANATAMLDLQDCLDVHPGDLPLPQRRLVALAALLVTDPELLLLDEPTAGLDTVSRNRVIDVVRERTARGRSTMAVTHDHVFAHEALDRAFVVRAHDVVDVGRVSAVLDNEMLPAPAALMVARSLGVPEEASRAGHVAAAIASRLSR